MPAHPVEITDDVHDMLLRLARSLKRRYPTSLNTVDICAEVEQRVVEHPSWFKKGSNPLDNKGLWGRIVINLLIDDHRKHGKRRAEQTAFDSAIEIAGAVGTAESEMIREETARRVHAAIEAFLNGTGPAQSFSLKVRTRMARVLQLILDDKTDAEISREADIPLSTVKADRLSLQAVLKLSAGEPR